MLKVTEHGVTITLNGKAQGDGLFWFASALLVGAVGVVLAMSFLSTKLAIGALLLLVVGSFIFNQMRQKKKTAVSNRITSGVLDVRAGMITHINASGIKQDKIMVKTTDRFENHGSSVTIYDENNARKCHLAGFENAKEVEVMQKVVQGQTLNKRNANIKMKSTR